MTATMSTTHVFITSAELVAIDAKANDCRRVYLDRPGIMSVDTSTGVYPGPAIAAKLTVDFGDGRVATAEAATRACQEFVTEAFLNGRFAHGN